MDDVRLGIIASILNFLRREFQLGYLDPENAEGLEVAIHCLENIYDVRNIVNNGCIPSLLDVFKEYTISRTLSARDPTDEEIHEAERYKVEGNMAMSNGHHVEAIELYSRAIQFNPRNAIYYCNRAAAHSKLNSHHAAVADCKVAIQLDPNYSKAYGRLGLAYCGLESYVNALENYKKAHELEPENEGYRRNFDLAQNKVAELCTCNYHENTASTSAVPNSNSNVNAVPSPQSVANEALNQMGMGSMMDMNALFGHPQLVNFASQMLADPVMQNMMSSIMNLEGGTGMQMLLQAGQRLARQMQNENPTFFNLLRQSFTEPGAQQGDRNYRPDSEEEDGGEPSHDKH